MNVLYECNLMKSKQTQSKQMQPKEWMQSNEPMQSNEWMQSKHVGWGEDANEYMHLFLWCASHSTTKSTNRRRGGDE